MKRRTFLQLIGLAPIAPALPELSAVEKFNRTAKALSTPFGRVFVEKATVKGNFAKALWPGVKAWYDEHYEIQGGAGPVLAQTPTSEEK